MDRPVELIPLVCFKCDTPVPAQPDEVAWVCSRCGQGLLLDESKGVAPLEVNYSAGLPANAKGKPFWVVEGIVDVQRQTYSGNKSDEALRFWSQPRRFFVPAYTCSLETLVDLGPRLLLNPPALQTGPTAAFEPVTLAPGDIQSMAEFIIMAIEAGRSDMLKQVGVNVKLSTPALWVLA
jgi:hypothetical protein